MAGKYIKKLLSLMFGLVLFWNSIVPSFNPKEKETIRFTEKDNLFQKWDDLFTSQETVSFSYKNHPFVTYGFLAINSKKDYFLYGIEEEKLMEFDTEGNFLRDIARKGEGPGEFVMMTNVFFDQEDNLFIYDISKRTISVFAYPEYQYLKQVKIKSSVSKIFIDDEGNFVTFSLYNFPDQLIRYTKEGKAIEKAFRPEDNILRIAMSRFNPGGMADIPSEGFLFIYPDKYSIYLSDYNLTIKKVYEPRRFSMFYPKARRFPQDLYPNEYSMEHSRWWDGFLHPGDIYYLKDKLFIVVLFETKGRMGKFYINLHDLNGMTYAKGLEVPFEGRIVAVNKGDVYIMEEEKLIDNNKILPQQLHRFKSKSWAEMQDSTEEKVSNLYN